MGARKTLVAGLFLLSGTASGMAQGYNQGGYIEADPQQQDYGPAPQEYAAPAEGGGPSWASGLQNYAGLRGSYALSRSTTTYAPTSPPTALRTSFSGGGGGSIYVGTRLPLNLRLELEALYRYQPLSRVGLNGTSVAASGNNQMAAPMLNLLWDIPVPGDAPLQPFVGMGVGAAYNITDAYDVAGGNNYMRGNKWDLAYSFMGGFAMPLSDSSRVTAMYRWMQVRDNGSKCGIAGGAGSRCYKTNINSSAVDLGFEMDL